MSVQYIRFDCDGDKTTDEDRIGVLSGCFARPRSRFLKSTNGFEMDARARDARLVNDIGDGGAWTEAAVVREGANAAAY